MYIEKPQKLKSGVYVTHLRLNGKHLTVYVRVAGYSDYSTMRKIYTHLAEADKNNDIQAMRDFFQ